MGKLHELLAVEGGKKGRWDAICKETSHVFAKGGHLFLAAIKTLTPNNPEETGEIDSEVVAEHSTMTTTVPARIEYMKPFFEEYIDVVFQKELANQRAVGELTLNGKVHENVPATFLLGMESKLANLRDTLKDTPTLASGVDWEKDPDHERAPYVYKSSDPVVTFRTKTVNKPFVLYAATDKHPAQVEKVSETVNTGRYKSQRWSGMLTSAQKAKMLSNLDALIEQCKIARQQANETTAPSDKIGAAIYEDIMQGVF